MACSCQEVLDYEKNEQYYRNYITQLSEENKKLALENASMMTIEPFEYKGQNYIYHICLEELFDKDCLGCMFVESSEEYKRKIERINELRKELRKEMLDNDILGKRNEHLRETGLDVKVPLEFLGR